MSFRLAFRGSYLGTYHKSRLRVRPESALPRSMTRPCDLNIKAHTCWMLSRSSSQIVRFPTSGSTSVIAVARLLLVFGLPRGNKMILRGTDVRMRPRGSEMSCSGKFMHRSASTNQSVLSGSRSILCLSQQIYAQLRKDDDRREGFILRVWRHRTVQESLRVSSRVNLHERRSLTRSKCCAWK